MSELPLASIRCITYNHEPYIRKCLEGFVMQQTNFKFEAIVHDDASTDGTAAIVAEFAEKYPDIIKPLYETENQYSKRDGSLNRIMRAHTRGKYVAFCEGDDYWIDPLKLQKQVDFLEANPEYGMVHTDAQCLTAKGEIKRNLNSYTRNRENRQGVDFIEDMLCYRGRARTATVVYRKDVYDKTYEESLPFRLPKFRLGDIQTWCTLARHSKVKYIDSETAVYVHSLNSASRPDPRNKVIFILSSTSLRMEYMKAYEFSEEMKKISTEKYVFAIALAKFKGIPFDLYKYDYNREYLSRTAKLVNDYAIARFIYFRIYQKSLVIIKDIKGLVKKCIGYKGK